MAYKGNQVSENSNENSSTPAEKLAELRKLTDRPQESAKEIAKQLEKPDERVAELMRQISERRMPVEQAIRHADKVIEEELAPKSDQALAEAKADPKNQEKVQLAREATDAEIALTDTLNRMREVQYGIA